MRRWLSLVVVVVVELLRELNWEGEGPAMVPRVREEMNPARRRTLRIPSVWVLCGREIMACLARKAFWILEQMSCGSIFIVLYEISFFRIICGGNIYLALFD